LASAEARILGLRTIRGSRPVDTFHRELGLLMIDACGISRSAEGLQRALVDLASLRQAFEQDLRLPPPTGIDAELEKALRLDDFFGLAELMLRDALAREESCGAHFRVEHQGPDGEAQRDDERFAHIAAWEFRQDGPPRRHTEPLGFSLLTPSTRNYR
jgi:succinate dehydrogenase / fumarate reductase flavoprotein subunit